MKPIKKKDWIGTLTILYQKHHVSIRHCAVYSTGLIKKLSVQMSICHVKKKKITAQAAVSMLTSIHYKYTQCSTYAVSTGTDALSNLYIVCPPYDGDSRFPKTVQYITEEKNTLMHYI